MHIKHRSHRWTVNLTHQVDGCGEPVHEVRKMRCEWLNQNRDTAVNRVWCDECQTLLKSRQGIGDRNSWFRIALFSGAESHDPTGAQVGAEIYEASDKVPSSLANHLV